MASENKKAEQQARRKLLKGIAAGSGAFVAGKSLPESWSRPVVDSVILPVHAQTSASNFSSTIALVFDDSAPGSNNMLAGLVNDAIAGETANTSTLCIESLDGKSFRFGYLLGSISNPNAIYRQDGGVVGGGPLCTGGGDYCFGSSYDQVCLTVTKIDSQGAHYVLRTGSNEEDFTISSGILPPGACPWDPASAACDKE